MEEKTSAIIRSSVVSKGFLKEEEEMKNRACKKTKCELVGYDSLPDYLKDNEFILGYYRCEWPLKETILSIFSIHNETLNIWTHLIGFLIFLSLAIITAMVVQREMSTSSSMQKYYLGQVVGTNLTEGLFACLLTTSSPDELGHPKRYFHANNLSNPCILTTIKDDIANSIIPQTTIPQTPHLMNPITRWPFFAFLFGAMFCLLTSSICHLILCHSKQTAYVMLRLDYAGISALIVTSFYPLVYYSFLCQPFYCHLYMTFITTFGVATVSVLLVPALQTANFRLVRATLFFCMGVSGLVPVMHKLVSFNHRPEVIMSTGYEFLMGTFYGLGVVVYAARIPERWVPGRFDVVGHSHQLFHLLVIAGAYTHYLAGLVYLKWRDIDKC
ncbi:heptahelical transmembrane protein 4-like [Typha angustifolia]|uniref:heptahelical transmembrane protein 4-like n=1 Tax=Typha angustifolia TaxID=59011 RepID=UPI003C2EA3FE